MRTYGKIVTTFWTKGSGRALRGKPHAQVLATYLMTCEQGNGSGLFYLPMMIMAYETGLSVQQTEEAMAFLSTAGVDFAYYDSGVELVWVPGTALYQVGPTLAPGDRRRIGLVNEVARYGTHRFASAFYAKYGKMYGISPPEGAALLEPSRTQQAPNQVPLTQYQDQGHKQDQGQGQHVGDVPPGTQPPSVQPVQPAKRGGRAPRCLCPEDFEPRPEDAKTLADAGLDVSLVVSEFIGHWRHEGKLGADWRAAFRKNVISIMTKDFLRDKYRAPPTPVPSRSGAPAAPAGPPAPAPADLIKRMGDFTAGRRSSLLDPGTGPEDGKP